MTSLDSFKCRKTLKVGSKTYVYYSLPAAEKNGLKGISKLPYSMKVLLENLLRNEDDRTVKKADIIAVSKWLRKRKLEHEVAFRPARVLMQDFTGVPAVVDLAAMRNAMQALGGDAEKINPLVPVDLVIDHSVIVNFFGDNKALGMAVVRRLDWELVLRRITRDGRQCNVHGRSETVLRIAPTHDSRGCRFKGADSTSGERFASARPRRRRRTRSVEPELSVRSSCRPSSFPTPA